MKQSVSLIAILGFSISNISHGFTLSTRPLSSTTTSSTTARHAIVAPPMILGPMIKKMRDDQAKKKMPMTDATEAANEAPGLRVGKKSWRWPPVWPYDAQFFVQNKKADEMEKSNNLNQMASALTGIAQSPMTDSSSSANGDAADDEFDAMKFWSTEGAVETQLDPEAAEKLKAHYRFYLRDDMSILELGAAEESYLPFKPSRHVGVGASMKQMETNPSLTERMVVDLNKVERGRDVDDDNFRMLAQEPFDAIIMANTISYLTNPREVLRSAWYLLKPGGILMIAFATQGATKADFRDYQTRMWTRYNDDQHMWMTGSFFQFSAGEGWVNLLGFDLSPESAKDMTNTGPMALLDQGKSNNIFVVQANKGYQDDSVNPDDPEPSIRSLCWMLPTLEGRDKNLVVPRLARVYETTESEEVRKAIEDHIPLLPRIYEELTKMDAFAFTFSMQAQLATDLLCDPKFTASKEQMLALREGLGLRKPGPDFWGPVGKNTAAIPVEEKISLLGYLVPCFGSGDPAQEETLQSFVTGLLPTYKVIQSKCPDLPEADVQLLGAELLAYELLTPGKTTREQFAVWLDALSKEEMLELLDIRKSYWRSAAEALNDYLEAEAEKQARLEELRAKMQQQKETARLERSMIFNPRTQKFEKYDNPNRKK
ncbi:hypothetical protein ACA910_000228 [Epithemia clementina (nom. ined.)]